MKRLIIAFVMVLVMLALPLTSVMAAPPTTVTIAWLEDGTRYWPDGTVQYSWTNEPVDAQFLITGKAYHLVDIADWYYYSLQNLNGSLIVSAGGILSGQATYTSAYSGLPIGERFEGTVTIDPVAGTLAGTYTQYAYAFGTWDEVFASYPGAAPDKSSNAAGWWFIGYTVYSAHQ